MYQIDNSTAAASQPTSTAAGTAGFFTDGNPATGDAATILPAEWLNAVMMELCNVITAAGLTLSKSSFTQLQTAIKILSKQPAVLADTGAANAYTAANTTPLVVGTWVDGVSQRVKIANTNTGASTYAPDGLAAIPIYGLGLQPLQGGELLAGGTAVLVRATIAGVNSGNPICVLVDCQGGAQQVPAGTKSNQAVNLGQADGRYAALAGLASQLFSAADGTTGKQVVNISQFIGSFGPTGYIRLPGGFILQWTNLTGSTGWAWTYPIAFPTGCYGAVATSGDTGPSFVTLYNTGASLLQGNRWNTAGAGVSGSVIIFALGY